MRLFFSNLDRPKAAAKLLARHAHHVKLSAAQEAVAGAIGYRDWHDMISSTLASPAPAARINLEQAKCIILSVADRLAADHGAVQYALSKSRLLGDLTLDDALRLRTMIWRDRLFGPPGRGKAGTIVRVKAPGLNRTPAYLKSMGRPTHLFYDTGYGICADFEVVTPRVPLEDFAPSRLWLPYGYWTLKDGSTVTFARDYKPLWHVADGGVTRLDPWLWIHGIEKETHFPTLAGTIAWSHGPARALALDHLTRNRLFELPRLLDAMPHLFAPDIDSISGAVARMQECAEQLAA